MKKRKELTEIECILAPIYESVNWSRVATKCFNKTPQWLYMKMHQQMRANGKPDEFSATQREQLSNHLTDLACKMLDVAQELKK